MSFRNLAIVAAIAGVSSLASAAVVAPGQTAVAINENNPVGGTVVASNTQPFATSNYTGLLTSTVISGDTSNIYGGMTFVYTLTNNPGSANAIQRLTINGFNSYVTDVSYKFGTGTTAPSFNDRDPTGGVVGFSFLGVPIGVGTLNAGTSTEQLVVQTNATTYVNVIANVSNGAVSQVNAIGPNGAITPEPTTLAALAGLGLVFRRRR